MAINWTQVNVPTILAVGGAVWAIVTYVNRLENLQGEQGRAISALVEQIKEIDRATDNMPYRVSQLEKSQSESVLRIDRMTELIVTSMDGVRKDVNVLGTKVEVLTTKIEGILPRQKVEVEQFGIPARN